MRMPSDEAISILDLLTLLCPALYDALRFRLFVTSNFTTVVGCAAIRNAAIRHYMPTILKHSTHPATAAFLFFIPHIKLIIHEHIHERSARHLSVGVMFTSNMDHTET